ncbi:MAG: hypothetical protein KatS3mg023_1793 [Armatimonadota bacterium]|nr:MAG: hypothetical protein KatS3mg023_1793 [Armatimonadota bacterium]
MRRLLLWLPILAVFTGVVVHADSPLRMRPGLRMPALLLKPTPQELIDIHHLGVANPKSLLRYIGPEWFERADNEASQEVRWRCRTYAVHFIGDIGDTDVIPELERIAQRYRLRGEEQIADVLLLTIERIRYRALGREAYVKEMMRWVQWSEPREGGRSKDYEYFDRVTEGARALAVIQAKEAVPLLLEVWQRPRWREGPWSLFLIRPLARLGDRRALEAIQHEMRAVFTPNYPAEQVPLEPGEPDPGCVYWLWRTEGMSLQQAVDTLVISMAGSYAKLKEDEVLRHYVGTAAIPQLLKYLSEPPHGESSEVAQGMVARLLGEWRVKEAVPRLLDLAETSGSRFVRVNSIMALGDIAAPETIENLIALAKQTSDGFSQTAAIHALGKFPDKRAVAALLDLFLNSPQAGVRITALQDLQNHGDLTTVSALEERLRTERDETIKRSIAFTIKHIRERLR